MKKLDFIMGMPVQVEIVGKSVEYKIFNKVFNYFKKIDEMYSPYKEGSEVGKFNRGEKITDEMSEILLLCEKTKKETKGYFDVKRPDGNIDPSGLVKGWAIYNASKIIRDGGYEDFIVDAGGDMEISGRNKNRKVWQIGIKNPFNMNEVVKVLHLTNCGLATSGTYEKGQHIYDPVNRRSVITDVLSISVVGPNIYDADRFATAAFAMGKKGITFIEDLKGYEGYMIGSNGLAAMTANFERYTIS
jgi:FAD:protein FMN transferase